MNCILKYSEVAVPTSKRGIIVFFWKWENWDNEQKDSTFHSIIF